MSGFSTNEEKKIRNETITIIVTIIRPTESRIKENKLAKATPKRVTDQKFSIVSNAGAINKIID